MNGPAPCASRSRSNNNTPMNKQQSIKVCLSVFFVLLVIASVLIGARVYEGGQSSKMPVPAAKSNAPDLAPSPPGQTGAELYQAQTEMNLYQKMLIAALDPYIQKSVRDYYGRKDVLAPPYVVKVLDATNPTGNQVTFELKLQAEPYVGPHDPVGIDDITLKISPTEINVMNFEHIKSFTLPPNMQ